MRVLVIGGGGREHALAWALARSPRVEALYCAPGNAGTAALGTNLPIKATDLGGVVAAARAHRIDLAVVGPEEPLAGGLVDRLREAGILTFGPTQSAARLEASKAFARKVMARAGVPTAEGRTFTDSPPGIAAAHAYADTFAAPPVIKADGLAAGKGVLVPATAAEAHAAIDDLLGGRFGAASRTIVIERRLAGREASAMAFVDGERIAPMPLSCDYKRAQDGDRGPNTGGMGVYSPPGFLAPAAAAALFARVHAPTVAAMQAAGSPFAGVLYAGLMVEGEAVRVLEFNARFGDPETQVILPRLESDLAEVLSACAEGRLDPAAVRWRESATVGVVLASGGYPGAYATGQPIRWLDAVDADVLVFHAGTALAEDGAVVTSGGRVLTVVAQAPTLAEARARVYENVARITFAGAFYRRDIAARELD